MTAGQDILKHDVVVAAKDMDNEKRSLLRPWTIKDVKIDLNKVTQCALVDINDVFEWYGRYRCNKANTTELEDETIVSYNMPMPGFETTFRDIVDYILRITFWIWHDKHVDLCQDYYSDTCLMHTMVGDLQGGEGASNIITNTWATLSTFSDRTLDGQNVIWSVEDWNKSTLEVNGSSFTTTTDSLAYYSSHLIYSRMTHDGPSADFGPPTNITATKVKTIADCVCYQNKIVKEWLMRDNAFLAISLGLDYKMLAKQQAQHDLLEGRNVLDVLSNERERVQANRIVLGELENSHDHLTMGSPTEPPSSSNALFGKEGVLCSTIDSFDPTFFAKQVFDMLWQRRQYDDITQFYDYRIEAHLTAGRDLYGTKDFLAHYLLEFQTGLSDIAISMDHVACIPYIDTTSGIVDVAVRWTLVAQHTGDSAVLGPKSDTPIYILASSHWRINVKNNTTRPRIREEWTVFDEMALCRQVETQRLLTSGGSASLTA